MPDTGKIALVADESVLGTVCPPGLEPEGFVAIPRRDRRGPEDVSAELTRRGIRQVIVLGPLPGESDALSRVDVDAIAWLNDPDAPNAEVERFKAVVATDAGAAAAQDAGTWRLEQLPVADFLFTRDAIPDTKIKRVFFDGPTSEKRDRYLQPVKHEFDVLHLVSGARPEDLSDLIGRCQVSIDLVEEPALVRRDRIGPAMANGLLVLAQQPVERPGLEEGEHIWTFDNPAKLELLIADALREPEVFLETRKNARMFAERLRTSASLPRVASYFS